MSESVVQNVLYEVRRTLVETTPSVVTNEALETEPSR